MVAPPDPVAVEAVAGPVRMPRRLLSVLQSEGLFNDATALVVFQTAVLATVSGGAVSAPTLVLRFVLGVVGRRRDRRRGGVVARWITARVTDTTGRSALTLVLPFAVYVAADEVGASGVVAVVVLALQLRAASGEDEAAERLVQRSFWDVVELLVTGVAFGLMGLDLRRCSRRAAPTCPGCCGTRRWSARSSSRVRVLWMLVAWWWCGRSDDPERAPRTGRETVVLSWCGMRGLATLALALSLPTVTAAGEAFPQRAEIVLIAGVGAGRTLVLPGFTLPVLVRMLGVAADADTEHAAEQAIVQRARRRPRPPARGGERVDGCPRRVGANLRQRMDRLDGLLRGEPRRRRTASGSRRCAATGRSCNRSRPRRSPPRARRCWPPAASPASTPRPPTACCAGSTCARCCLRD